VGSIPLGDSRKLPIAAHRLKAIYLITVVHTTGAGLVSATSQIVICQRTLMRMLKALIVYGGGHERGKGCSSLVSH
jgi:hypothetical protein